MAAWFMLLPVLTACSFSAALHSAPGAHRMRALASAQQVQHAGTRIKDLEDTLCRYPDAGAWRQEHLQYQVYYQAGPLWMGAGSMDLRLTRDWRQPGAPWHAQAVAHSSARIDRFFPVRDLYESWMDPGTGMPTAFWRDVREGNYAFQWRYAFDRNEASLSYTHARPSGELEGQLEEVPACAGDLLSTLHAIRHFPWADAAAGTRMPLHMVVDGRVQVLAVELLERSRIAPTQAFGGGLLQRQRRIARLDHGR
jgi:hypothetical protein